LIWRFIYFCDQLDELVYELKRILKPNGKLYIEQNLPTIASSIKFMFDAYPPNQFVSPDLLNRKMNISGFKLIVEKAYKGKHYIFNREL
tara:strand:- start:423 stop:689 length:267 start_codon:yes stop_codon:yes gene_type:complete